MALTQGPSLVKAQLRLASQRLSQLQHQKDSQGFIVRKDIATLLRQENVWLAREKARNLYVEDTATDMLERLEMHVEVLLEHFDELDLESPLSPIVLESAATIVHAAPYVNLQDLQIVRNFLIDRLGSEFASSTSTNGRNHHCVSPLVLNALESPPPSALEINQYLRKIAHSFGVNWEPEPTRHDLVNELSDMFSSSSQTVDLPALRRLCRYGIPDKPAWLRPRIWKLMFSLLSPTKSTWAAEQRKLRDDYYDLVRRLLEPFSISEPPSMPLAPMDASLLDISKQLSRIPSNLFVHLKQAPAVACALDSDVRSAGAPTPCACNLDLRLAILRNEDLLSTPAFEMLSGQDSQHDSQSAGADFAARKSQTILQDANSLNLPNVHPKHTSSLLRILYIHATINAGILAPHVPSLVVPLYIVLSQEVEPEDVAHVEADTFWLFEALMAEFSEYEDQDVDGLRLKQLGERVAWADKHLSDFLASVHEDLTQRYLIIHSVRWLTTLLTHSIPFSSVILVWDVLFARPMRSRGTNFKMDYLLDLCTAMLLCTRSKLLQDASPPLRSEQVEASGYHPELNDAFMEGMLFLQSYPVESAGGIDCILLTAWDLLQRRHDERKTEKEGMPGLGVRIKDAVFRGFNPQPPLSAEGNQSVDDDGSQTETISNSKPATFANRIATTFWNGVTNRTAMEPPPSPPTPSTPITPSPPTSPSGEDSQGSSNTYGTLRGYAEKLKDSDTVAAFSKVSSNWRAKALVTRWGGALDSSKVEDGRLSLKMVEATKGNIKIDTDSKTSDTSSSSSRRSSVYSPPPRPAFFRPPRDSYILSDTLLASPNFQITPNAGDVIKSKNKISLAAITRSSTPKSAPRPLLLGSAAIITPHNGTVSRGPRSDPTHSSHDWDYVRLRKGKHRDSLSSVSSVSDSTNRFQNSNTSDRNANFDVSSRRIPLNRQSISPLAPHYRVQLSKYPSRTSVTTRHTGQECVDRVPGDFSPAQGIDIPNQQFKSTLQTTSSLVLSFDTDSHVSESSKHHGSINLESTEDQLDSVPHSKRPFGKKALPLHNETFEDTSDSSVIKMPIRAARIRAKRYQTHPVNLQLLGPVEQPPDPNVLRVEWPCEDQELSMTPRAPNFELSRPTSTSPKPARYPGRASAEGRDARIRKLSGSQRTRKISSDSRDAANDARDSAAEEGDDEGYDDLLSAYESEEGSQIYSI